MSYPKRRRLDLNQNSLDKSDSEIGLVSKSKKSAKTTTATDYAKTAKYIEFIRSQDVINNQQSASRYNLRSAKKNVKNMISPYIDSLNIIHPHILKEIKNCINKNYKT
jgi:hypothetical protein